MLTGPILAHWNIIVNAPGVRGSLVRAAIAEGRVLVGIMVNEAAVASMRDAFSKRHAYQSSLQDIQQKAARAPQKPLTRGPKPVAREQKPIGQDPYAYDTSSSDDEMLSFDIEKGKDLADRAVWAPAVSGTGADSWSSSALAWASAAAQTAPAKRRRSGSPIAVSSDESPERVAPLIVPKFPRRANPPLFSQFSAQDATQPGVSSGAPAFSLKSPEGSQTEPQLAKPARPAASRFAELRARIAEKQRSLQESIEIAGAQEPASNVSQASGNSDTQSGPIKPLDAVQEPPKYIKEIWYK